MKPQKSLTEEKIPKMTDEQVITFLAEKVMGYKGEDGMYFLDDIERCWDPTEYVDDVIEALDKTLGHQNYAITVGASWEGSQDPFFCLLRKKDGAAIYDVGTGHGNKRARAICNALLMFLKDK